MSETVNVARTSRSEYDVFYEYRVKTQKLARGAIYVLMLEIEGNDYDAGRVTAEVSKLPGVSETNPEHAAPMEVLIMDEDARPVFQMAALWHLDQIYLQPIHLAFVHGGEALKRGYFLVDETNTDMALELHELVGAGSDISNSL